MAQESEAKEQRLSKAEATLNERLDRLLGKRRQLEEELEVVRGEMMSCDAQLKEVFSVCLSLYFSLSLSLISLSLSLLF